MIRLRRTTRMTLREIGACFNVSPAAACMAISDRHNAQQDERKKPAADPAPKYVAPVYESVIRPIPKDRLMAGNGRTARPIAS